jgi:hypothetical protein
MIGTMTESILLSEEELKIIRKHRDQKAQDELRRSKKSQALALASEYERFLGINGRGTSFSIFVNEFGYEAKDASFMYGVVMDIFKAADQWG